MKLPQLDLHAHISPDLDPVELNALDAVVFAVTRNFKEASQALGRRDAQVVWGVGVHPGLVGPHKAFKRAEFDALIARTAFVGEVGLDGGSRVDKQLQLANLREIFRSLQETPRVVSLHCYDATRVIVDEIERGRTVGAVLHWWLGSASDTQRAVELGCYFSVNPSSVRRAEVLESIPLSRLLPETDHPAGDKFGSRPRRPGNCRDAERAIGLLHGLSPDQVRLHLWKNLASLIDEAAVEHLLPPTVARIAQAARAS